MALSLAEVEYMDASQAMCEAIWTRQILVVVIWSEDGSYSDLRDNNICIKLFENLVIHDRPKHIDI